MKKILLAIGVCTAATAFAQNEPDSIHVVINQNKNGNLRILDTIVPIAQQQALFNWMQANGWQAPPPPPPPLPPGAPLPPPPPGAPRMIEQEIIMEGDSTTSPNGERHMINMQMNGDSMMMPPPPPGQCRMVITDDGNGPQGQGGAMIMRTDGPPMGGDVTMEVTEKDTIINGETRKLIIRTERIVLPPNPPAPPTPPGNGKQPMPPNGKRDLVVYPNPTDGMITVEFDVVPKEKTSLRVTDMNGKVVYTEEITDEQGKHVTRQINLTDKGKGAFTVEVKSKSKVIAERVILQ